MYRVWSFLSEYSLLLILGALVATFGGMAGPIAI